MVAMTFSDLERQGHRGSVEVVKKLLLAYGDEDKAVQALQDGINGFGHDDDGDKFEWDGDTVQRVEKDEVMADFRAGLGVFAPHAAKPDAFAPEGAAPPLSVLTEIRDNLADMTARFGEIEKKLGILPPQTTPRGKFEL